MRYSKMIIAMRSKTIRVSVEKLCKLILQEFPENNIFYNFYEGFQIKTITLLALNITIKKNRTVLPWFVCARYAELSQIDVNLSIKLYTIIQNEAQNSIQSQGKE